MSDPDRFAVDVVDGLDCTYEAVPWPFATDHRDAIAQHWAAAVRERPQLFNGRVLMQTRGRVERRPGQNASVFRAAYTDVDFASFLAWRDFNRPAPGFRNGFGMAALRGADGAFLLGEMGGHTANAGRIYFPSGTPDLDDIVGETVDILGSIRRELVEETGLDPATLRFAPRVTVVQDPARVCFLQDVDAAEEADALKTQIEARLARDLEPELARMHVVRGPSDITAAMPPFVALYLRRAFGADQPG